MINASTVQSGNLRSLLQECGLFDAAFYLHNHGEEVCALGTDPLTHYLEHGERDGNDPHVLFSTSYYMCQCPELAGQGISALAHYVLEGWQRVNPHVMFDTAFYLNSYPEVATSGMPPLTHFLKVGASLGYDPCLEFDTSFYMAQDPGIAAIGWNPLVHYVKCGRKEGRPTRNYRLDELPPTFCRDYELLRQLEPLLPASESLRDFVFGRPLTESRAGVAYFKLCDQLLKPFSYLFLIPELQSVGPRFCETLSRTIAAHGPDSILLLLTDSTNRDHQPSLVQDLTIALLVEPGEELTTDEKVRILTRLIIQARPDAVYNFGSAIARKAYMEFDRQLEPYFKLPED